MCLLCLKHSSRGLNCAGARAHRAAMGLKLRQRPGCWGCALGASPSKKGCINICLKDGLKMVWGCTWRTWREHVWDDTSTRHGFPAGRGLFLLVFHTACTPKRPSHSSQVESDDLGKSARKEVTLDFASNFCKTKKNHLWIHDVTSRPAALVRGEPLCWQEHTVSGSVRLSRISPAVPHRRFSGSDLSWLCSALSQH